MSKIKMSLGISLHSLLPVLVVLVIIDIGVSQTLITLIALELIALILPDHTETFVPGLFGTPNQGH
jgi:hypothetical protein